MTNQLATYQRIKSLLATGKVVAASAVVIQEAEYAELRTRRALKPGEVVVDSDKVVPAGHKAVPEVQAQRLSDTNLVWVPKAVYQTLNPDPTTTNIARSHYESLLRKIPPPDTTNVTLTYLQSLLDKIPPPGTSEGQIRKELLNLRGPLTNVVILLDASGSMGEKGRLRMPRWKEATEVIAAWVSYLPIQRCAVEVFSDSSQSYTTNERGEPDYWDMKSKMNRSNLVNQIRRREPGGNTATWSALAHAYTNYAKADTIILFTDGKPYVPRVNPAGRVDGLGVPDAASISREEMRRVLASVQQHPNIPINVVGLGDYFEKEQANFLLELCRITGGSFLGR